ncbi:hypothetical protein [Dongshaea marina]|uniref:hypothetical protein n=1 Tax=Dongshaea marina TaxID=2047966 RepID=UPI0019027DAC|nr:hypothetical protein [Dongshaea marina]
MGQAVGSVVFGVLGFVLVKRVTRKMAACHEHQQKVLVTEPAIPPTPFCSSRAYMAQDDEER